MKEMIEETKDIMKRNSIKEVNILTNFKELIEKLFSGIKELEPKQFDHFFFFNPLEIESKDNFFNESSKLLMKHFINLMIGKANTFY